MPDLRNEFGNLAEVHRSLKGNTLNVDPNPFVHKIGKCLETPIAHDDRPAQAKSYLRGPQVSEIESIELNARANQPERVSRVVHQHHLPKVGLAVNPEDCRDVLDRVDGQPYRTRNCRVHYHLLDFVVSQSIIGNENLLRARAREPSFKDLAMNEPIINSYQNDGHYSDKPLNELRLNSRATVGRNGR
jgi:hypothetical protein